MIWHQIGINQITLSERFRYIDLERGGYVKEYLYMWPPFLLHYFFFAIVESDLHQYEYSV